MNSKIQLDSSANYDDEDDTFDGLIFSITDIDSEDEADGNEADITTATPCARKLPEESQAFMSVRQKRLAKANLSLESAIPKARLYWHIAFQKIKSMRLKDPWLQFNIHRMPMQRAIRHRYSATRRKWIKDDVLIKMETTPFSRGALRQCFRTKKLSSFARSWDWSKAANYVAKRYIEDVPRSVYFEDVQLQMDAKLWGEDYNRHNPPKKVDIIQMGVIELINEPGSPLYHLEHFIEGIYTKYNSNSGFVDEEQRQTPQAFSHFSFERSGHRLIVVDVQGVGDLYTDPQIHTIEGEAYGEGNLGCRGMALFFHSHVCNKICQSLQLTGFDLAPSTRMQLKEYTAYVNRRGSAMQTRVKDQEPIQICRSLRPSGRLESISESRFRGRSLSNASEDSGNHELMSPISADASNGGMGNGQPFHYPLSARCSYPSGDSSIDDQSLLVGSLPDDSTNDPANTLIGVGQPRSTRPHTASRDRSLSNCDEFNNLRKKRYSDGRDRSISGDADFTSGSVGRRRRRVTSGEASLMSELGSSSFCGSPLSEMEAIQAMLEQLGADATNLPRREKRPSCVEAELEFLQEKMSILRAAGGRVDEEDELANRNSREDDFLEEPCEEELSVLGLIHHELAKYHEIGRFCMHSNPGQSSSIGIANNSQSEAPLSPMALSHIDWDACLFHEERAGELRIPEALVNLARLYLDLPRTIAAMFCDYEMPPCTDEEAQQRMDKGAKFMIQAAELNFPEAVIYCAKAFDRGTGLGSHKADWSLALRYYERYLNEHEANNGDPDADVGVYCDATIEDPVYSILGRMGEMYSAGGPNLLEDPRKAGDLLNEAGEEAQRAMKGRLANKFFMAAEEAWALVPDDDDDDEASSVE